MNFTDIIKTFLLGIIEGITEWLPVSSTGHIELFNHFFSPDFSDRFFDLFEVVIQLGAILAVVLIYWKKLLPLKFKKGRRPKIDRDIMTLWVRILISCIPAAVIGVLFGDYFDALFYKPLPISIALIAFGVLFMIVEIFNKKRPTVTSVADITVKTALIIGAFQVIAAVFPGVSRSGATIIGALLIGVSRTVAAEYTFYLAVPVMAGASLLKLFKFGLDFTAAETGYLLIGTVTAFVVSLFAIQFLVGFVKKHDFKPFGIYRILLGILVLILL